MSTVEQLDRPADSTLEADPQLVQQTKQHIRSLVNEIGRLSQSNCSVEDFYDGFLNRVTTALASVGGAIWTVDDRHGLQLQYQVNLARARLAESEVSQYQHGLLLRKVVADGQSTLVQPQAGPADEDEAANPTDLLLVLGVIKIDGQVQAIVEILQRPGGGPVTQRGYLRFLVRMCDLASDYLKSRKLRHFNDRQQLWDRLERFIHTVHRSLDSRDTAYAIANEGRRLIEADRVSVALSQGRRLKVEAVSGLDTVNRRAHEVKLLGRLATAVCRGGSPLWYHGDTEDLPPQIEDKLSPYLDRSHAKLVAIIPLQRQQDSSEGSERRAKGAVAALIVEQLNDDRMSPSLVKRIDVVAQHGADALSNSLQYSSLFLLPLWRALGKALSVLALRNLPKTLLVVGLLAGLVAALCFVPTGFDLSAPGTLRPAVRRDIFARIDGTVVDVPIKPGQMVHQGQLIARLENNKLEAEIIGLRGQKNETQKQISAIDRTLLDNPNMRPVDENQLSGRLAQLRQAEASVQRQLVLYEEQKKNLIMTSPFDGQVATWQVKDKLLRRPVERGQNLMTVVDPSGEWELELQMSERRMGHIDRADRRSDKPLEVTYILATHPGAEFRGEVTSIDRTAEVRDENGNAVRVRVAIDKSELPDLRNGAKVTAKIHCGQRSLGYAWFHELIETVQAKVLFWF